MVTAARVARAALAACNEQELLRCARAQDFLPWSCFFTSLPLYGLTRPRAAAAALHARFPAAAAQAITLFSPAWAGGGGDAPQPGASAAAFEAATGARALPPAPSKVVSASQVDAASEADRVAMLQCAPQMCVSPGEPTAAAFVCARGDALLVHSDDWPKGAFADHEAAWAGGACHLP